MPFPGKPMSTPGRPTTDRDDQDRPAKPGRNNVLRWRPRRPKGDTQAAEYPLWSMHKQQWRIDCQLQGGGRDHWKAVFFINGCWLFSCRFRSWALAVSAADDKHADLVASGWTAVVAGQDALDSTEAS